MSSIRRLCNVSRSARDAAGTAVHKTDDSGHDHAPGQTSPEQGRVINGTHPLTSSSSSRVGNDVYATVDRHWSRQARRNNEAAARGTCLGYRLCIAHIRLRTRTTPSHARIVTPEERVWGEVCALDSHIRAAAAHASSFLCSSSGAMPSTDCFVCGRMIEEAENTVAAEAEEKEKDTAGVVRRLFQCRTNNVAPLPRPGRGESSLKLGSQEGADATVTPAPFSTCCADEVHSGDTPVNVYPCASYAMDKTRFDCAAGDGGGVGVQAMHDAGSPLRRRTCLTRHGRVVRCLGKCRRAEDRVTDEARGAWIDAERYDRALIEYAEAAACAPWHRMGIAVLPTGSPAAAPVEVEVEAGVPRNRAGAAHECTCATTRKITTTLAKEVARCAWCSHSHTKDDRRGGGASTSHDTTHANTSCANTTDFFAPSHLSQAMCVKQRILISRLVMEKESMLRTAELLPSMLSARRALLQSEESVRYALLAGARAYRRISSVLPHSLLVAREPYAYTNTCYAYATSQRCHAGACGYARVVYVCLLESYARAAVDTYRAYQSELGRWFEAFNCVRACHAARDALVCHGERMWAKLVGYDEFCIHLAHRADAVGSVPQVDSTPDARQKEAEAPGRQDVTHAVVSREKEDVVACDAAVEPLSREATTEKTKPAAQWLNRPMPAWMQERVRARRADSNFCTDPLYHMVVEVCTIQERMARYLVEQERNKWASLMCAEEEGRQALTCRAVVLAEQTMDAMPITSSEHVSPTDSYGGSYAVPVSDSNDVLSCAERVQKIEGDDIDTSAGGSFGVREERSLCILDIHVAQHLIDMEMMYRRHVTRMYIDTLFASI